MSLRTRQDAALEPVRAALTGQARELAATITRQAVGAAAARVRQARQDADAGVARSRAEGVRQGQLIAAAELNLARRAARSSTLSRESATRQYLTDRIRDAVLALREDDDYPLLRQRLISLAARQAGPGAVITDHADGGVIATAPGLRVDCSLSRLADRAIAALESRLAELCADPDPAAPDAKDRR